MKQSETLVAPVARDQAQQDFVAVGVVV
ncbi:hypothetical protein Cabther_B0267 [Chloracidobacterium thermophilum B]|uniref:Uncharacterized protein n=1 Tax=Chloracidobacterium thermophilum (strain B) TaxID=981222 RepID=G2LKI3_CHLTF|nr:hypothetical protein Cabther_B0267 [Chloracidobacterium thermophilum B]